MQGKRSQKPKLIVILGPTACGKTKLAVTLAKKYHGEIASADSRQVYQGMDVGTGKDLKEYGKVPYHLIDTTKPTQRFSLAKYQQLAYKAIDDILKRGKTPFLVGGTGLYLQAIIDGYQLTNVKPDYKLRAKLEKLSLKKLQQLYQRVRADFKSAPQLNQSDINNKRRLIRYLEVRADFKSAPAGNQPRYDCLILGIRLARTTINHRIDNRLKHRLEKEGLINEVKRLRQSGLSWKKLDDFGLEYRYISRYLQQNVRADFKSAPYQEMQTQLAIAIHQFAKRQMTWFKRMENIQWIKDNKSADKLIDNFTKSA